MSLMSPCPASVLLIEDDVRLRGAIATYLEERGYPTVGAEHVDEAMEMLAQLERPCLVLVDPLTIPPDWGSLFRALTAEDRVATLPMVLASITAPGLLIRPVAVKRLLDFEVVFRIAQDHCCRGGAPGQGAGGRDEQRESGF